MGNKKIKKSKKKKVPKFHHIYFEVLGINIYVIICSRDEYEKAILYEFKENPPPKDDTVLATFETYKKEKIKVGVIWLRRNHKNKELSHECLHATHWMMFKKGIWLTDSSEEIYAYTIEYLFEKIKGYKR